MRVFNEINATLWMHAGFKLYVRLLRTKSLNKTKQGRVLNDYVNAEIGTDAA